MLRLEVAFEFGRTTMMYRTDTRARAALRLAMPLLRGLRDDRARRRGGGEVWTIDPDQPLLDAARDVKRLQERSLLVLDSRIDDLLRLARIDALTFERECAAVHESEERGSAAAMEFLESLRSKLGRRGNDSTPSLIEPGDVVCEGSVGCDVPESPCLAYIRTKSSTLAAEVACDPWERR